MSFLNLNEANLTPIKAWVKGVPVEAEAVKQLKNIAGLPFIYSHVAVMPDVHVGKGASIGSVIATKGAIIPAAVGVDLGCGMAAQLTNFVASDLPDDLSALRSMIEAAVPHGRTNNGGSGDRGAWGSFEAAVFNKLDDDLKTQVIGIDKRFNKLAEKYPRLGKAVKGAFRHAGTLGTGNHFIEICLDEQDRVWIMLHSGSRGVGNAIGQTFINIAKEEAVRKGLDLPDMDLAHLELDTEFYSDYCFGVSTAQDFAKLNRTIMMRNTIEVFAKFMGRPLTTTLDAVNCHHNYVSHETHLGEDVIVTRKGAVSAADGQLGIIPGSMGAKSFIVRGKGNPDSFCSCSHGAGRVMSRTAAKKVFTLADHIRDTAGVECRKDESVLDETPKAYKNIDDVMSAQADLVEIVHTLRQIVCVKG